MKTIFSFAVLLLMYSCNNNKNNKSLSEKSTEISSKDTIYGEDLSNEMRENSEKHHPLEKINFFDKHNKKLLAYSRDTIIIEIVYQSEKFPKLNDSYVIDFDVVSNNMKVLQRLSRNKFSLFIEPNSEPFVFDIYLSSKNNVFQESYVGPNKTIAHKTVPKIFLFRKTYPVAVN